MKQTVLSCERADVLWIGLSGKVGLEYEPLSPETNTGKIIKTIEQGLPNQKFYKTNLVKCAPLDEDKKLRYPTSSEMQSCWHFLQNEINLIQPKIIFLLGTNVTKFIAKQYQFHIENLSISFEYDFINLTQYIIVPIHHPSFIVIYRRKQLNAYIENIQKLITQTIRVNSKK